jgi:hypothetical protein
MDMAMGRLRISTITATALSFASVLCLPACGGDDARDDDAAGSGSGGSGGRVATGGGAGRGGSVSSSGGSAGTAITAGRGGSGGNQNAAGSTGKGGPAGASGSSMGGSDGKGGKGGSMNGEAGTPDPPGGDTGNSPYEIECHGDTVSCGDPTSLLCLGLRVETEVFGYSCSNECESDADCSDLPASAEAAAGCVDFVNNKYCLLVCKDGDEEASCPDGMYCYSYEGATIGYCLWK